MIVTPSEVSGYREEGLTVRNLKASVGISLMNIENTEVTNKVTMKESEIQRLVNDIAQKSVEEKMTALFKEQTAGFDSYIKDQLKEQMDENLKQFKNIPVSAEEKQAEKEANEVFPTFGHWLLAVRTARKTGQITKGLTFVNKDGKHTEVVEKTAGHMEEGDDPQGGFLVPEVFLPKLQQIALENSIVRPNGATVIPPIKTDSIKIPYIDDTSHASNVFGGVLPYWTAEAASKEATKPKFGQMELTPHKLAGVTYTSNELLMDSAIALQSLIYRMFGSAWGYFEDDAFLTGTGVGQPLGIQNCNATINNLRHTVGNIELEDLAEMYMRMLPSSHSTAVWVINPTVIPQLIQLGTGNAAAASGKNLIWIDPSQGAAKQLPMKILGRPVFISEKMQALGTAGDIGYYDMKYYLIFDRQRITIDSSIHVAFETDETCWRFVLRVGGQCWPQSDITLRRGGTTVSPFVQLSAATS